MGGSTILIQDKCYTHAAKNPTHTTKPFCFLFYNKQLDRLRRIKSVKQRIDLKHPMEFATKLYVRTFPFS